MIEGGCQPKCTRTMEQHEKSLGSIRSLFAMQEARVRRQEELVAALQVTGRPTNAARKTLASMNRTLMTILGEVARLGALGSDNSN